jgi:hypothetical protein
MLDDCPELENFVDAEYSKAIKWLRILGAEIYPPQPYGIERNYFRYFRFRRSE